MIQLHECDQGQMVKAQGSGYLDISQLLLLLPVPDRQDVIVGIVHSAEEGAAVLREKQGKYISCINQLIQLSTEANPK